jgi:glutamyl-tRNA synthetase/glutamyl-Q tRNA(Asp) synthetase
MPARAAPPVSRFAPAPTGYLHLGHVVNAIYVWGVTRQAGGRVLLRIEDHDRARSRREFELAILDDLDWLGFVPDAPSTDRFRAGACDGRQSDRHQVYESALARLRSQGLVYGCGCSRSLIAAADKSQGGARYPGTCRRKGLLEGPDRATRVRFEPSVERFEDLRHGWQEQRPAEQCGDLLARGRDRAWTYQFAAAVDDFTQGVTLVIRGDDLLGSTGRQILLARLLGRLEPPRFLHHPLVMKTPAQKLSKSDRDTGVRDLRAQGWSRSRVIGEAAGIAGLIDARTPTTMTARDVETLDFDLRGSLPRP